MNKKLISTLAVGALVSGVASAQDKLKSLEDRIEALETEKSLSLLKFGGSLRMRYDNIKKEEDNTEDKFNPIRLFFSLDASANVSPKLNFYGRLGSSYVINNMELQNNGQKLPTNASRDHRGPELYLERAFLAYSLLDTVALNAGRLPTIDGPPYEYYDGISRAGSYPALAYDAQLDGFALSYTPIKNKTYELALRGIYAPFYNSAFDVNGDYGAAERGGLTGGDLAEQTPFYTLMTELTVKPAAIIDSFLFVGQYNNFSHLRTNDVIARGTDLRLVASSPSLGGTGIQPGGALNAGLPPNTLYLQGSNLDFDWNSAVAAFDFKNVAKTNIDFSFSYAHTTVESRGYIEQNTTINTISGGALAEIGNAIHAGHGILTDKAADKNEGDAYLFTLKYHTPWNHHVGGEYFHGTKYLQLFEQNSDNLTGFYMTRGNAYHAWYTMPFAQDAMRLRIGYTLQDHDYSKGYYGPVTKSELKETTIYSSLRFDF